MNTNEQNEQAARERDEERESRYREVRVSWEVLGPLLALRGEVLDEALDEGAEDWDVRKRLARTRVPR